MKLLRTFLFCFLCVPGVFADSVIAGDDENNSAPEKQIILILGDSLSAAYNMETRDAWPNLLQTRLNQDGYPWQVFNSSIVGDTTEGGLTRLPRLLDRYRPPIVILELGGNDGLRGLSPQVTRDNLAAMIEMSAGQGAQLLLTGIRIPPNYGDQYVRLFESIYPSLAEKYQTALVPFFMQDIAMVPGMIQPDGVHPTVEAQSVLLDNLWPLLEPMLGSAELEVVE